MEKIIAELNRDEVVGVAGGATLTEKLVNVRDWDASVIEGCCTQKCCKNEEQPGEGSNPWL
ncbi:hypothetical protein CR152_19260 [Massilia violaceinigra]|uniref:Uncharacterized protein n=1 Tax=Massilia violaceinigra TaxID=2045208 RepID=A0A2D2DN60_9BURK|nr:hypothetical protein [Massilia violaceinigra]ATQ76428.1 hypothetical protein CR152_19260 [Massilia violaceinigra]